MNLTIAIPTFTGFYESLHSLAIDDEAQQAVADESGFFDEDDELAVGAFNAFHYTSEMLTEYAKAYVKRWTAHVEEETGYDLKAEFSELYSPREYNFETDRIFVKVPEESVRHMIKWMDKQVWADLIQKRLEPRPGFAPFYSNSVHSSDWDLTQFKDWGPAKLELLCEAWLKTEGDLEDQLQRADAEIVETMQSNGDVHSVVWNHAPEKFVELVNKRDALKEAG